MMSAGEAMGDRERISSEEAVAPDDVELPSPAAIEPTGRDPNHASGFELRPSDLSRLQTAMVSISVGGIRRLVSTGTTVVQHIVASPPVRYVGDIAGEISAALAEDSGYDWRQAGNRAEAQVARVFAVVIPVVVDSIDPANIIDRIDVNALIDKVDIEAVLNRVDLNRILASVDLDALFARVDLDELIERLDIDAVLNQVDLNGILASVDLDALFARVDLDELIERLDINAVMDRVDIAEISERIRVWNIVAKSTGAAAGSAVEVARDQGAELETLLGRTLDRIRRQDSNAIPGPGQLDSEGGDQAT
jgi:hypothetical protein